MKAACWYGTKQIKVETVPDPKIHHPTDAIIKVTATAICGSDLHIYNGYVSEMNKGDILGHEFMGEVVEVGSAVRKVSKGDRVVASCTISCGECEYCKKNQWSFCPNTNPLGEIQKKHHHTVTAGVYGFSAIYGAYAGGQAQYARVAHADVGLLKVPAGLPDEKVLFLSDIFPTGFMAAENCRIERGQNVAVWGCGPVGQMAMLSARLQGAGKIFAIDYIPERLSLARECNRAQIIDFSKSSDVVEELRHHTDGEGPHCCIDAVGMEAHGSAVSRLMNKVSESVGLQADHPICVQQAISACRKGGTVSIAGVYNGQADPLPLGLAFAKGLTLRMGPVHINHYMKPLLDRIVSGEVDPSFIVTHQLKLNDAPKAYELFDKKQDHCIKVVMRPN